MDVIPFHISVGTTYGWFFIRIFYQLDLRALRTSHDTFQN